MLIGNWEATTSGMPESWSACATLAAWVTTDPCAALSHEARVTTVGRPPPPSARRPRAIASSSPVTVRSASSDPVAHIATSRELGAVGEHVHVRERPATGELGELLDRRVAQHGQAAARHRAPGHVGNELGRLPRLELPEQSIEMGVERHLRTRHEEDVRLPRPTHGRAHRPADLTGHLDRVGGLAQQSDVRRQVRSQRDVGHLDRQERQFGCGHDDPQVGERSAHRALGAELAGESGDLAEHGGEVAPDSRPCPAQPGHGVGGRHVVAQLLDDRQQVAVLVRDAHRARRVLTAHPEVIRQR